MTINEAIENLEERKAFLQKTCKDCWDPAIDMALNGLKLIRQFTDDLDDCINESKDIFEASENFDDLVDCENYTRLTTYCACRKMLKKLKYAWRINAENHF